MTWGCLFLLLEEDWLSLGVKGQRLSILQLHF